MGVPLVEGRDLVCRRTTCSCARPGRDAGDVIYRRIDDDFLDPLQFRPESLLGCPGILNAARAGRSPSPTRGQRRSRRQAVYPYVPSMIRYYLGEDPVLQTSRPTWSKTPTSGRARAHRPAGPEAGGRFRGRRSGDRSPATDEQLAVWPSQVVADPRHWTAQKIVALSTSPTYTSEGFEPRHIDLRPFAVNDGQRVWVVPGGLTRVALREGGLVVNSSQGGGSKDTWVVGGERSPCPCSPPRQASPLIRPGRRWTWGRGRRRERRAAAATAAAGGHMVTAPS